MRYIFSAIVLILLAGEAMAQVPDSVLVRQRYDKMEVYIPMRDGVKLFTSIYIPKDKSKTYPFLMQRTCYSVAPYGPDKFRKTLGPSKYALYDGYIFVYQDVRGRWMSEGVFDNMTPNIPGNDPKNKKAVDESSDTWDTIDWLIKKHQRQQWQSRAVGYFLSGLLHRGRHTRCAPRAARLLAPGTHCRFLLR
jgi:hypothetical protein